MILKLYITFSGQNMIGFSESLVDDSGFPRNDIDVYQVRHARHQIICLQNDLKILMKKIETGIQEIHAEFPATEPSGASASTAEPTTRFVQFTEKPERIIPIAKVNLVSQGSPAEFCVKQFDLLKKNLKSIN